MAEYSGAATSGGQTPSADGPIVLDGRQLIRIGAVHRGFLYQHLYGATCLLMAGTAGVERIVVEGDEDIEIILPNRTVYVQIKSRVGKLSPRDVSEGLCCKNREA